MKNLVNLQTSILSNLIGFRVQNFDGQCMQLPHLPVSQLIQDLVVITIPYHGV